MFSQVKFLLAILLCTLSVGCAAKNYVWKSEPVKASAEHAYFNASIEASCASTGCSYFTLTIHNKMDKALALDWNKTLYIVRGKTKDGFMFDGVVYSRKNNPKPLEIILAGQSLTKNIWPCERVSFAVSEYDGWKKVAMPAGFKSGRHRGWVHDAMPVGENGVLLTVTVDGDYISKKMLVGLSRNQSQN